MNSLLLREVAPRDGLQAESVILDVDSRVQFCLELIAAGCRFIEVGAFVRSDKVPSMAGSAEVCAQVHHAAADEVTVSALVPNGLEAIKHPCLSQQIRCLSLGDMTRFAGDCAWRT